MSGVFLSSRLAIHSRTSPSDRGISVKLNLGTILGSPAKLLVGRSMSQSGTGLIRLAISSAIVVKNLLNVLAIVAGLEIKTLS